MKSKFVVVCALVGAMSSFVPSIASSAPVNEPTNLSDLLQARSAKKAKEGQKGVKAKQVEKSTKKTATKKKAAKAAKNNLKQKSGTDGRPYSNLIEQYAKSYGVPTALAHAVVRHESNYRPDVRGKAGEIGLMQIKLSTARGLGYSGSAKGLYEPSTNIQYGMKYLAMAHKLGGGSTCGTILKYNAGHGAKRMNPTSANYCNKVKAYMRSF